jgi:hypothetical protein
MSNKAHIVAQFLAEHDSVMLELSVKGQNIKTFNAVDFRRELFTFAQEVGGIVRIDGKARRGVSLYEDYWHAACALMPDDVARTDLIHALLFIFITSQGHDVLLTRSWAARRNTIFNRLVDERTLASDVVNALRRESWLNVDVIEQLIARGDIFKR